MGWLDSCQNGTELLKNEFHLRADVYRAGKNSTSPSSAFPKSTYSLRWASHNCDHGLINLFAKQRLLQVGHHDPGDGLVEVMPARYKAAQNRRSSKLYPHVVGVGSRNVRQTIATAAEQPAKQLW